MSAPIPKVICLPGGVAPAAQRYQPLVGRLGGRAHVHLKELEVYADDAPPAGYSVDDELAALEKLADSLGLPRFHLVGYSGGGFVSLAFAGTRPGRLASLALFEPARIPGRLSPAEQEFADVQRGRLAGRSGADFMTAFVSGQIKPGAQVPPPPQQPAPGMQKRPGGIAALVKAFDAYEFDRERLRACHFPVYLGYGDQTHDIESVKAGILATLLPDFQVQRHHGVHHFSPSEQIYSAAHVATLEVLWARSPVAELSL
jgi:pimeloyl-ACP methyl ester carboxylesterase